MKESPVEAWFRMVTALQRARANGSESVSVALGNESLGRLIGWLALVEDRARMTPADRARLLARLALLEKGEEPMETNGMEPYVRDWLERALALGPRSEREQAELALAAKALDLAYGALNLGQQAAFRQALATFHALLETFGYDCVGYRIVEGVRQEWVLPGE